MRRKGPAAASQASAPRWPETRSAAAASEDARRQGRQRHFEQVAQAFGAYGECVEDPAEVPAAIARALQAVDEGRSALLNVQIGLQ